MTSFFGIKDSVLAFFSKIPRRISPIFFSGFERKHLFITTCSEKQCTGSLMLNVKQEKYQKIDLVSYTCCNMFLFKSWHSKNLFFYCGFIACFQVDHRVKKLEKLWALQKGGTVLKLKV